MHILDIKIDDISNSDALQRVDDFLNSENQHMIFTPNPEILVTAKKDQYFREVLNKSSLNLCDGRGLQLLGGIKNRIPGIDFVKEICGLAEKAGKSVYLLGSAHEHVVEMAAHSLKKKYPNLKIAGYNKGSELFISEGRLRYNGTDNDSVLDDIIMKAPDILFVAFGHGKQEKWIYEHLPDTPSVKVAMGVGGTFDTFAGKVKRAPLWMRKIGLEWLWRLIKEPKRIKRIFRAVFVFPLLVILSKKHYIGEYENEIRS